VTGAVSGGGQERLGPGPEPGSDAKVPSWLGRQPHRGGWGTPRPAYRPSEPGTLSSVTDAQSYVCHSRGDFEVLTSVASVEVLQTSQTQAELGFFAQLALATTSRVLQADPRVKSAAQSGREKRVFRLVETDRSVQKSSGRGQNVQM